MIEGVNYIQATTADSYRKMKNARSGGVSKKTGSNGDRFHCAVCDKSYLRKRHLQRHMRDECIGIPPRFSCDLCPSRFRRKYHMVRHLTSKHGVPPAIAQQASGNSHRNQSSCLSPSIHKDEHVVICTMTGENLSLNQQQQQQHNLNSCDNGLPENLTMRKENYESKPPLYLNPHHHHHHHLNGGGADSASPSHITSGDSGSDCNGGDTTGSSPIPGRHIIHMPTYGLTGAITAISAAAAHVEEKDAKILLEAAAAAAQAAAVAAANNTQHSPVEGNENIAKNQLPTTLATYKTAANPLIITTSPGNNANELQFIKAEPLTPTKAASTSAATTSSANMNMLDEEWKMKLSLQLISNSLLKERLMNTMPFAYQNK